MDKKIGRPKKAVTRERIVAVRLSQNEHLRLEELATIDAIPSAAVARQAILQHLNRRGL